MLRSLVGSEMCIRDSPCTACTRSGGTYRLRSLQHGLHPCSPSCALTYKEHVPHFFTCFVFFAVVLILASFEADATLGLHYMHTVGFIHCDVKLENTLICRSGGPTRFVGKVTDPGLWCGESGFESEDIDFQEGNKVREKSPRLEPVYASAAPAVWGQTINTSIQSRTSVAKSHLAESQVSPSWKAFLVERCLFPVELCSHQGLF